MGILAGRRERSVWSAFKEIGLMGTPERPPVSILDAEYIDQVDV
jgi:hypothetical protein